MIKRLMNWWKGNLLLDMDLPYTYSRIGEMTIIEYEGSLPKYIPEQSFYERNMM